MTFWQRHQQAQRLRAIPLPAVLPLCGAQPDPADPRKWHTPAGVLSVTGAQFMNWNLGVGGGGAIDLVIQVHHLDFKAAVDWLAHHFPDARAPEPPTPTRPSGRTLPLPTPANLGRVQRYLIAQRGLPAPLLDPLIQAGTLYADGHANAVFLLWPAGAGTADRGKPNVPVGAELRGTTGCRWLGLAPGSRKDAGYFSLPAAPLPANVAALPAGRHGGQPVILCESAIDAISCYALHPGHRCLSTAGARPNPAWLAPLLDQGGPVYCGFDADPTGDALARAMIALYPTIQRLRPARHDWNDVLTERV